MGAYFEEQTPTVDVGCNTFLRQGRELCSSKSQSVVSVHQVVGMARMLLRLKPTNEEVAHGFIRDVNMTEVYMLVGTCPKVPSSFMSRYPQSYGMMSPKAPMYTQTATWSFWLKSFWMKASGRMSCAQATRRLKQAWHAEHAT